MTHCREPTPTELLWHLNANPPKTDYDRGYLAAVLDLDGGSHPMTKRLHKMLAPKTGK